MSHPLLNGKQKLREWAPPIVPAAPGVPLVKSTHQLEVRAVWMDGTHSTDWDMPQKHLAPLLKAAMRKLVNWKESEGFQFIQAPPPTWRPPPEGRWRRFPNAGFWWTGPEEAIVIGKFVHRGDPGESDFDGTAGPWPVAPERQVGAENLEATGGKVAYRVGGFWTVREHLVEVREERP